MFCHTLMLKPTKTTLPFYQMTLWDIFRVHHRPSAHVAILNRVLANATSWLWPLRAFWILLSPF